MTDSNDSEIELDLSGYDADAAAAATTAPTERRIAYVPLEELKADPRNPKAHDLETIDKSVARFGVVDTITRDERTGFIVSGHGRTETLRAMHKRGEAAPDGVRVDPKTGRWLVPVTVGWASKSDTEAAAALIALNRTTELGGWVDESLLQLLADLGNAPETGEDLFAGVGFDLADLDDLRAAADEQTFSGDLTEEAAELRQDLGHDDSGTPDGAEDQGRRLVVLDYSLEEFDLVAPRVRALRMRLGASSNAEAIMQHLLKLISDEELAAVSEEATPDAGDGADYAEVEVSTSHRGDEENS